MSRWRSQLAPTQGQQAYPAAPTPVAYVNENNNYQAPALPGPLANPTPGGAITAVLLANRE